MNAKEIILNICIMDQDDECIEIYGSYNEAAEALPKFDRGCAIGYHGETVIEGLPISVTDKSMKEVIQTLDAMH